MEAVDTTPDPLPAVKVWVDNTLQPIQPDDDGFPMSPGDTEVFAKILYGAPDSPLLLGDDFNASGPSQFYTPVAHSSDPTSLLDKPFRNPTNEGPVSGQSDFIPLEEGQLDSSLDEARAQESPRASTTTKEIEEDGKTDTSEEKRKRKWFIRKRLQKRTITRANLLKALVLEAERCGWVEVSKQAETKKTNYFGWERVKVDKTHKTEFGKMLGDMIKTHFNGTTHFNGVINDLELYKFSANEGVKAKGGFYEDYVQNIEGFSCEPHHTDPA